MSRFSGLCLVLLLMVLLVSAKHSDQEKLLRGYYEGRSGDIVLNVAQREDAFVSIISSETEYSEKSIKDVNVGDLFSHITGTLPLNQEVDRSGFPQNNVFSQPKSLLLITFPGLTKSDVEKLPLLHKQRLVKIETTSAPYDTVAELTTLLTGVEPRVHGVVARQWRDRTAYHHEEALPVRGNLASLWSKSLGGRAAVLSASSNTELAAALGAHAALLQAEPRWPHGLLMWDGSSRLVSNPAGASRAVSQSAADAALFGQAGPALFAELQQLAELPLFAADTAVLLRDSTPDYVAVALASLAGVKSRFGSDSKQWARALELASAAISKLRSAMSGDTVVAALILPEAATVAPLSSDYVTEYGVEQVGAQLYVENLEEVAQLCELLPSALCAHSLRREAASESHRELRQSNDTTSPDTPPPDTPDITSDQVGEMQIAGWFGLLVVLAAAGGILSMCNAAGAPDTLLYRPTHQRAVAGSHQLN